MRRAIAAASCVLAIVAGAAEAKKSHGGMVGSAGLAGEALPLYTSPGALAAAAMVGKEGSKPNETFAGLSPNSWGGQLEVNPDTSAYQEPGQEVVDENVARRLNIFLPDTRTLVNSKLYPARAVGVFGGCTATLILAPSIIVTNAHCLDFLANGKLDSKSWSRVFYAGLNKGTFLGSSTPKAMWYNRELDYAVIKLKTDLSATLGRFGVRWRSTNWFVATTRPISIIAYSGDHCSSFSTCVAKQCNGKTRGTKLIDATYGGIIRAVVHDCDVTRGSSGSSLYHLEGVIPVQDALNFGENRKGGEKSLTLQSYSDEYANVARCSEDWAVGYNKIKNL